MVYDNKTSLHTASCAWLQVFQEFKRYAGLLSSPAVAASLHSEVHAAMQLIDRHLEHIQSDFESREKVNLNWCFSQATADFDDAGLLLWAGVVSQLLRQHASLTTGLLLSASPGQDCPAAA